MNISSAALTVFGVGFIILAGTVFHTAQGAFARFDRAEAIMKDAPALLDRADKVTDKMILAGEKLSISAKEAKAALPDLGTKAGEAGANMLEGLVNRMHKNGNKDAAE